MSGDESAGRAATSRDEADGDGNDGGVTGLVLRVDRKRIVIELDALCGTDGARGQDVEAALRGSVHRGRGRAKSAVAVGDRVLVDEPLPGEFVVTEVLPRSSVLLRPEIVGRWRNQVLVANADRAVLVFAHARPQPKAGLVDRLLVACHAGNVPPLLVFNKVDLEPDPETTELVELYEGLGYTTLRTSADSGIGIDEVRELLVGRCSVFAGPSGTGKSSLINAALPGVELRTGEISRTTNKGRHTTTAAQLVRVDDENPERGHVIDTPGIKEFGLVGIDPRELDLHFPELPVPGECRFDDCRHLSEPACAVLDAVSAGAVAQSRYDSYVTFLAEIEAAGARR